MLPTKIRSLLFLVIYNYLYHDNFIDYDTSSETNIVERISDIYIDANYSKTQLQEKPSFGPDEIEALKDFFKEFKSLLPTIQTEARKYINWDKTSFILQSILLLLLAELQGISSGGIQVTADQKKLITRSYLKLCQQYIDNQSVSLLHAVLTKVLD